MRLTPEQIAEQDWFLDHTPDSINNSNNEIKSCMTFIYTILAIIVILIIATNVIS